jgi:predicted enzyme related to lactoylglutathione lyase
MISVSLSIDVPSLEEGERFYASAFGFEKRAAPVPGVIVMRAGDSEVCLLEKRAGTTPAPGSDDTRRYERHWTPVHIDIHVDDFAGTVAKAIAAGAKREQLFEDAKHGSVAFMSDPFGHGFCVIERKPRKPA